MLITEHRRNPKGLVLALYAEAIEIASRNIIEGGMQYFFVRPCFCIDWGSSTPLIDYE
jgi:hypothetical protein